jgi:rhamnulokinase
MIPGKKYIGFDLGAESGRCTVASCQDEKISLIEVHRFPTHNIKYYNGFHWDILAIYREITEGLTRAVKLFGPDFEGISVDTWGVDYVLTDPEARILGYPYHYRDDRTDNIMEDVFKIISREELYNCTGIQFAPINTIFQLFTESRRKLNLLKTADKMLLIPDFLNFLLCGVKKAEYSIASTTGLIDPETRNWSWDIIKRLGFPENIFPEVVEPGTLLGKIIPSLAKETGINPETNVYASTGHDTASAVVSVPATGAENWAFLSSGTWSLMGVEIKHPLRTGLSMKYNFTNEGGAEKTTRLLKNILGFWPLQECKRYWNEKGKDFDYTTLMNLAKRNGHTKAWIDLSDQRFLKAGKMPEKIIAFLKETNQPAHNNPGYITSVILESLAFSYRDTIRELEEVTGKKIEKIHAVGGGIKNELLNQYMADAVGIPVYAGPVEGTIIGNIGVQAIASGAVQNLESWRKIVESSFEIKKFNAADNEYFNENEKNYKKYLK